MLLRLGANVMMCLTEQVLSQRRRFAYFRGVIIGLSLSITSSGVFRTAIDGVCRMRHFNWYSYGDRNICAATCGGLALTAI